MSVMHPRVTKVFQRPDWSRWAKNSLTHCSTTSEHFRCRTTVKPVADRMIVAWYSLHDAVGTDEMAIGWPFALPSRSIPRQAMSASLIGRLGSSTFRLSTTTVSMSLTGSCFSSEFGTRALPSWDLEDEVEQSFGRPCRQSNGRSKRTYELTSSIVPRGTSFHRSVELLGVFSYCVLILRGFHGAAAAACSRFQRNAVPSTQMRCMDHGQPARQRRPTAFFIPRRLADLHRARPGARTILSNGTTCSGPLRRA